MANKLGYCMKIWYVPLSMSATFLLDSVFQNAYLYLDFSVFSTLLQSLFSLHCFTYPDYNVPTDGNEWLEMGQNRTEIQERISSLSIKIFLLTTYNMVISLNYG
ncbi:hypothetical protein CHS0354_022007 [Potamilus streckersoni]|uniref:Uncharacterized protein n=1 Tax=Potamilus streckersoni TaxID=2493646 RepID=A0AAE0TIP5_9BIVA|nr:hypothetical protein CHS0354_022007 [Potamilus streckersoni]